jgi:malate dehydrogenase
MIGGVLCQEIPKRGLARTLALVDVAPPDLAKGKCLDIAEGSPVAGFDAYFEAGQDYDVLADADLVINTAGVPRKPKPDGSLPTREELLEVNLKITDQVAAGIQKHCPNAIIISVANPLDAIVYRLNQMLKRDRATLVGMAGVLDSARYRYFVADAAGVSVENVQALVLGGHGDTMVPVRSACRIAGLPVTHFLDEDTLQGIEQRTRKAGGEVVKLLGTGSAFVSPAWSALEMAEAIVFDKRKIMPASARLEGEYGIEGLYVGVPGLLGAGGVEKVLEIELADNEKKDLMASAEAVRKTCDEVDSIIGK